MIIYTDNLQYARCALVNSPDFRPFDANREPDQYRALIARLFEANVIYRAEDNTSGFWKHLFIVKRAICSHYDLVSEFCRENIPVPDGSLFLAGSGGNFHGFKGRPWAGLEGNIHLVTYFEPNCVLEQVAVSLTVLATVSVVQTIDMIKSLKGQSGIKWINDILINDSKVAGVLAFTQAEGNSITAAAVGIGLNVEKTPQIPISDFVPKAGSIHQFENRSEETKFSHVLDNLILTLDRNTRLLLTGKYNELIDQYRRRSVIIGKNVAIRPDTDDDEKKVLYTGRVLAIGDDLRLQIEGVPQPVSAGRLVLIP
ncbi:MAG: biotin--[acetyl-CoA-carboxylase] ligase [Candidatus Zixiibacteriota bacterium]